MKKGRMSEKDRLEMIRDILVVVGGICLIVAVVMLGRGISDDVQTRNQQAELKAMIDAATPKNLGQSTGRGTGTLSKPAQGGTTQTAEPGSEAEEIVEEYIETPTSMLPQYALLYELNSDIVGWLYIVGTRIDYPVMQTPSNPYYYLRRDFYGSYNTNGCLFADPASRVGTGKAAYDYEEGTTPGTNLMIYGHHMRSKEMFGELDLYATRAYGEAHPVICFDTLYEHREYQLLAAFRSEIYHVDDDVFKYYQFFNADTEEEFRNFVDNVKALALYDTGVTAEFGDELITLSTCDNSSEYGRFVVVAKRIRYEDETEE